MTALFIDTSSLVKFYYPEPDSDSVEAALLKADRLYISQLTLVEIASALSKKVRMGELAKQAETIIWNTFLDDLQASTIEQVDLNDRHYTKAADLIREFGGKDGIKTLDALQLSVAHGLPHAAFFCSDKVLNQVARKMGLKLARL